jgi:hypothetical protein
LELKLHYEIDRKRKQQRYVAETWVFLPKTLGLTKSTYPKERFYEDTAAFVRMKTPAVALRALANTDQAKGWFDATKRPLDRILSGGRGASKAIRRLKLLGCIYKRAISDDGAALLAEFDTLDEVGGGSLATRLETLEQRLTKFRTEMSDAMLRLRSLSARCEQSVMPKRVSDIWRAVDEYMALVAEEIFTDLVTVLDNALATVSESAPVGPIRAVRNQLADDAIEQYRYRRARSYPSYIQPGEPNEQLPYRMHVLKRIVSSVLWLDVREADPGRVALNVVGVIAAMAAMAFAILVTIWASLNFEMASATFVIIAVSSYAVKDRIKEWGRKVLGRQVARYLPDRQTEVLDEDSGARIGVCNEAVSIMSSGDVPPDIRALRHVDHTSTAATDGRPETVIRYTKQVALSSEALEAGLDGVRGLNDIIRFNLGRLRERMDSPWEVHRIVDPDTREVVTHKCARVYHVNLVLRFATVRGRQRVFETERVRVILDQEGIKRIEAVDHTRPALSIQTSLAPVLDVAAE